MKFNLYTNTNYCRVIKDIPKGCELITYYGDDYGKNLGTKVHLMDRYEGKEDHRTAGELCGECDQLFTTSEDLGSHRCKAKKKKRSGVTKRRRRSWCW